MDQDFISQTALDQMTGSDYDQMMKAAIPYLPPKGQQILSVYEKAKELRNTISLFSNTGNIVSMCAAPCAEPLEIVRDIRRFCYGKSRQTLDGILNMMAIVQMAQLLNAPVKEEPANQNESNQEGSL